MAITDSIVQNGSVDVRYRGGALWKGFRGVLAVGDHLYMGAEYGLVVYDNRVPADPRVVTRVYYGEPVSHLSVAGDLLVLSFGYDYYGQTWEVLDISDPESPAEVEGLPWIPGAKDVEAVGEMLYVADGGLSVYHARSPATRLGHLPLDGSTLDVAVSDTLVAVETATGIAIVSTRDPANPELLHQTVMDPGPELTLDFDLDGDVLYATDFNHLPSGEFVVRAYRIPDFEQPVGEFLAGMYMDRTPAYAAEDGLLYDFTRNLKVSRLQETGGFEALGALDLADDRSLGFCLDGEIGYFSHTEGWDAVDMGDPGDPRRTGGAQVATSHLTQLAVYGDRACVAARQDSVWILDISDPSRLRITDSTTFTGNSGGVALTQADLVVATSEGIDSFDYGGNGFTASFFLPQGGGFHAVAFGNGRLHATGPYGVYSFNAYGSAQIALRTSCSYPEVTGDLAFNGDHLLSIASRDGLRSTRYTDSWICDVDFYAINETLFDVVAQNGYAYVGAASGGLQVFDVGDGANLVRTAVAPQVPYAANLAVAGQYLFVQGSLGELRVMDLSDPAQPELVAECAVPRFIQGLEAAGNLLYAVNTNGILVYEIGLAVASERHPVETVDTVDQAIQVSVAGGTGLATGHLHYREGGRQDFAASRIMSWNASEQLLTDQFPAELLGLRGIEYYIEIQRGTHTARVGSPEAPYVFQVRFPESVGMTPVALPDAEYRICSVPIDVGEVDDVTVEAVFVDDLGPYAEGNWRIGSYLQATGTVAEFDQARPVSPAEAYWLVARGSRVYGTEGRSMLPDYRDPGGRRYHRVPLRYDAASDNGWNLMPNPFPFRVAWDDVRFLVDGRLVDGHPSSAVVDIAYWYDGHGYDIGVATIPAWGGVAVHANRAGVEALVRYREVPNPEKVGPASSRGPRLKNGEWRLSLDLISSGYVDRANEFGASFGAERGRDRFDSPEPPAPRGAARLWFRLPEGSDKAWRIDVRPPGGGVERWDLQLSPGTERTLELRGMEALPGGYSVWLTWGERSEVPLDGTQRVRVPDEVEFLTLWVGSPEDLRDDAGLELVARTTMWPNYPNPFNARTTIVFALPAAARVSLDVFDVRGRRVRRLAAGEYPAGSHEVAWDGRDEGGRPAASGTYFYRLQVGGRVDTRKMVLVK